MNEEQAERIIELLEQLNEKLSLKKISEDISQLQLAVEKIEEFLVNQ